MDEISLTSSVQQSLLSLQRAAKAREQSAQHLATGLKVNDVVDEPVSYFQAKALSDRASDFLEAKDGIEQAISAVEAASVGTEAMSEITRQMRGIALSARGGSDEQRQAASERYDMLRTQLDELAKDISYSGVNLVQSEPDDLNVGLNDTGSSSVTIEGRASDSSGLGISSASFFGNFATDAAIDMATAELSEATQTLRSNAASFGSNVALLDARSDFVVNLSNTLEGGASKLVIADMNEEAARQLSSQVRQELTLTSMKITGSSERSILQLIT